MAGAMRDILICLALSKSALCPSSPLFIVTDSFPDGKTSSSMKLIVHIRLVMSPKFVEMPYVAEMTLCLSIWIAYSLCIKGQATRCWMWGRLDASWCGMCRETAPWVRCPAYTILADWMSQTAPLPVTGEKTVVLLVNHSRGEGGKKVFRKASQLWPACEYDVGLTT